MAFGNFARSPQEYARQQQAQRPAPAPDPGLPPGAGGYIVPAGPSYSNVGPGAAAGTAKGMDPTFRERLMAMIAASGGRLTIKSGYRSHAEQQALWEKSDKTGKWVARPGHSNHEKGIAGDLAGDLRWAHQHAAEFGLYFPMEWEPWHIEPMGSRSGKGWSGPAASDSGYSTPVNGMKLRDDPGGLSDVTDLRKSIDYQMALFGSLLESPDFILGAPQLPSMFTSMPELV